jgi:uroporphyrin-III C-methyltransferase/precorrin-2 dehydrogenase/sirohydrochlorin ferrochelatase
LGRGAEEGVALRAAGVPFEVIQGITTAVAAPAGAGIPLTHRGLASGFVVVSGHHDTSYRPILGSLEPGSATVVILMGLSNRRGIATCLLERGWTVDTPAAVVFAAASSRERTWIGTLRALGDTPHADESEDPGTIVIGTVVNLHTVLRDVGMSTPAAEGKG